MSKKKVIYICSILYLVISIGFLHVGCKFKTPYGILDLLIVLTLLPGALLSIAGSIFWGTTGEAIGSLITVFMLFFYLEKSKKINK